MKEKPWLNKPFLPNEAVQNLVTERVGLLGAEVARKRKGRK